MALKQAIISGNGALIQDLDILICVKGLTSVDTL